ncbi:MAG: pectinesterase family protein [Bacteroides sp.]|nr:pectinesterase family protein [Bacteroides sp.]
MTRRLWKVVFVLACLLGSFSLHAEFKDIKVDLTNGNLLTETEISGGSSFTFGVAVGADGSVTRVATDDASAAIVLTGKFHSNEHGWGNFSSTVAVEGPVKITMGSCAWGGDVTVKNAGGETVATFNTNTGACFHGDKEKNVASTNYKGGATTLTIAGGSYTPYIAVEAINPEDLVEDVEVSFGFGAYEGAGILPQNEKIEVGKTFTIPANFTMYQEGKTLVGWTDGSKNYELGEIVTVNAPLALTPVFVDNTVSLADRTEPVTLRWDFQRQNGAPTVGFQGVKGFWVTQTKIGTEVIDVKLDFDATSGKIANANWGDWAQMNGGTKFVAPACQGAVVSFESYSPTTTTTVDGQLVKDGTKNPSFTCVGNLENVEIVIGDGSYYRYIQVVLPVVKSAGGVSYEKAPASVTWAFNNASYETATLDPENAFAFAAVSIGEAQATGTGTGQAVNENGETVTFVKLKPKNGGSDLVEWSLKPAKGLTFTPTKVSAYIARFGTDASSGVNVSVKKAGGETIALGTFTAPRNNKSQADDKYGSNDDYTNRFVIELTPAQQAELASTEGFSLFASIGVGNSKEGGFSDVRIEGVIDGAVEAVEKYTLEAVTSPEGAGVVNLYPKSESYDAGSPVKVSVDKNFGYEFINWTDASGKVVSTETSFTYEVAASTVLTANFNALRTFELDYNVEGGANLYMVQPTPAPTVVDGKNMYEEGTNVTLTASSNPILTFTNWSDGQSSSEIEVMMDGDKSLVATYSAIDFVAGWDFHKAGADGRPADFAAADNDAAALVLRTADGATSGWLDKSTVAAGGYEGRPGAVNWRTTGLGEYYWQTVVNAEAFTDLKVITAMVYNYNAYQKYNVEYSIDGENWHTVGTIFMEGAKNWTDGEFNLPAEANNQKTLYIRWIADKTSDKDGTTSDNDGACLGASYIIGTAKLIDDGTAPVLVSVVPEEGSNTASINGKIVLTFDEKVKVKEGTAATLGDLKLTPSVTGKTILFQYKNLAYGTKYTFTLPANVVSDLTDNAVKDAITINFTTKTRPVVAKALYDAEVSTVDELVAALKAAGSRADNSKRFRIFIHDGFYRIPASTTATKTGNDKKAYPDPTTYVSAPNISFIGESMEGVVITNTVPVAEGDNGFGAANVLEGIGNGDVLRLEKTATGSYFQNLTMKSSMGDSRGRDIVLNDNSNKTIMKDVCLWAYQDTYVSNNDKARFYFEGGLLRGRTDYLCGKGDVYYNAVTLQMCEKGGYITAPSNPLKYGYVFKDCEIVGETEDVDGNFTLGRPWGSGTPGARFIDTKMTAKPSAAGWNEMGTGWPMRFAEYNSMTSTGTVIDLSQRKRIFAETHENDPVLTKEEADALSYEAVMGGDDDWDPASLAEQAPAPSNVVMNNGLITWDDNDYVSCWAICKDGKVIAFTIEPKFEVAESRAEDAVYSVRAANEMGGLGEAVTVGGATSGIDSIDADAEVVSTVYYNLQGVRVNADTKGVLIKVETLASGQTKTSRVIVK